MVPYSTSDGHKVPGQKVGPQGECPELQKESIHTYVLDRQDDLVELQFSRLARTQGNTHKLKAKPPSPDLVAELQDKLPQPAGDDPIVPKDANFDPTSYLMMADANEPVDLEYARQMAQVGRVEGFDVDLIHYVGEKTAVKRAVGQPNVTYIATDVDSACWTEDYGERTMSGGLVVPAYLADPEEVDKAIDEGRHQRFSGGQLLGDFSEHGAVSEGNYQQVLISAGKSLGLQMREARSHIEGGNVLSGTLPDGARYAIVGQDSLAVSQAVTSAGLDDMAKDLGIPRKNLFVVEQPGEFHLDMRMMCGAPGQVIVNDARAACEKQTEWMRQDHAAAKPEKPDSGFLSWLSYKKQTWSWNREGRRIEARIEAMQDEAERRAAYEELTVRDLLSTGLDVKRMAAVFVDPKNPQEDTANFVNGRGGVNARGERFFVGLGAEPRLEAHAAKELLQHGFARVHFLGRDLTPDTLDLSGGIKCRTKPAGKPVSLGSIPSKVWVTESRS